MKKNLKQIFAISLTLVLMIGIVSTNTFANEDTSKFKNSYLKTNEKNEQEDIKKIVSETILEAEQKIKTEKLKMANIEEIYNSKEYYDILEKKLSENNLKLLNKEQLCKKEYNTRNITSNIYIQKPMLFKYGNNKLYIHAFAQWKNKAWKNDRNFGDHYDNIEKKYDMGGDDSLGIWFNSPYSNDIDLIRHEFNFR